MAKDTTKPDAAKTDKPLDDKDYQEFAKTEEGKAAEQNKVVEGGAAEGTESKEPEPEKHPLVAAAEHNETAPGNARDAAAREAAAAVKPPPFQAPAMTPADGWLVTKQYVLCWVRAEKGKVVEVQAASEYEATHVDTGTGEPHDALVDKGVEVALQKK